VQPFERSSTNKTPGLPQLSDGPRSLCQRETVSGRTSRRSLCKNVVHGVDRFASPKLWLDNSIVGDRATLAADVDGDGDDDLVAVDGGVIRVLRTQ
jgi:hypothetical protein